MSADAILDYRADPSLGKEETVAYLSQTMFKSHQTIGYFSLLPNLDLGYELVEDAYDRYRNAPIDGMNGMTVNDILTEPTTGIVRDIKTRWSIPEIDATIHFFKCYSSVVGAGRGMALNAIIIGGHTNADDVRSQPLITSLYPVICSGSRTKMILL